MMSFTIKGNTPSKKNSKRVFCRGKYPVVLPSKLHENWHKIASKELKTLIDCRQIELESVLPIEKVYYIILEFYRSTNRIYDVTNASESAMDLMVDVGILKDDNFKVTPKVFCIHGGKDKDNALCRVYIFTQNTELEKQKMFEILTRDD